MRLLGSGVALADGRGHGEGIGMAGERQDWAGGEEEWDEVVGGTSGGGHHWELCPTSGCRVQHGSALLTTCKIIHGGWSSPIAGAHGFPQGNEHPLPLRRHQWLPRLPQEAVATVLASLPIQEAGNRIGLSHFCAGLVLIESRSGCPKECVSQYKLQKFIGKALQYLPLSHY